MIEKLKEITINYYQSYINKLFNNNLNQINSINLFNDIKNFLEKFLKKYNNNISINLIIQEEEELKIDFESITLNVLKELYNFNIQFLNDDELKNSEENNKIELSGEDNINDLISNWWFVSEKTNESDDKDIKAKKTDSFNIDSFEVNKRNYNYIKHDIINKLYSYDIEKINIK